MGVVLRFTEAGTDDCKDGYRERFSPRRAECSQLDGFADVE